MVADLLLPPESLSWLQERLPGEVQRGDLSEAYGFEHPLVGGVELDRAWVQQLPSQRQLFRWWVVFTGNDGDPLLEEGPLSRSLAPSAPLFRDTSEHGPVARNHSFFLKPAYQRQGIGRRVYASEDVLYRKWGVREVQVMATRAGPSVWVRKFGFLPKEPEMLAVDYRGWARIRGLATTPPATPAEYPEDFLNSRPGLELYREVA